MGTCTYIVSGFMRCGTSMEMQCLEAAGLEAVYSKGRSKLSDVHGDKHYQPNPAGLYELDAGEYKEAGFPKKFKGKLIKCLYYDIMALCVGKYKIVFMLRDPEEIRQSYEAFFNINRNISKDSFYAVLANFNTVANEYIERLNNRKDVDLVVAQYRDIVRSPMSHFTHLYRRGWPIDPQIAAVKVDPSLCRFKLENLEMGI